MFSVWNLLFFLLVLWVIIYLFTVLKSICKLRKINTCINVLYKLVQITSSHLDSPISSLPNSLLRTKEFVEAIDKVMLYYPLMQSLISYLPCDLDYSYSPYQNTYNARRIFNELLMERNRQLLRFRSSLNPFMSLRKLFMLPSRFLKYIGFNPNVFASRIFNIVIWVLGVIFNFFSEEIKQFFLSLIHELFGA